MHELSVAVSIVEGVEEEAAHHEGRVTAIHLRLGPLSGVIKEALVSAFDLACAGTTVEGARLIVEDVPLVIYCAACQAEQTVASMQWLCCPQCDAPASRVVRGKELEIVALEME